MGRMYGELVTSYRMARADVRGVLRYGWDAPRRYEQVWFRPDQCVDRVRDRYPVYHSGRVLDGDWDLDPEPLEEHPTFVACRQHWEDGLPWEETGVYDRLLDRIAATGAACDDCRTLDDVVARYAKLDRMFTQVRAERRLRTHAEITGGHRRRGFGNIRVCFGREGTPLFGRGGYHRLAVATILGLEVAPGVVGLVHLDAVPRWRNASGRGRASAAGARCVPSLDDDPMIPRPAVRGDPSTPRPSTSGWIHRGE